MSKWQLPTIWYGRTALPVGWTKSGFGTRAPKSSAERVEKVLQRGSLAHGKHCFDRQARPQFAISEDGADSIELGFRDHDLGTKEGTASLFVGEAVGRHCPH